MRILAVGKLGPGSSGESITHAFASLGHDVRAIDTTRWLRPTTISVERARLAGMGSVTPKSDQQLWRSIREAEAGWKPDVLVGFKTINFDQHMLLSSRATAKVHISLDDVSNPDNTTRRYLESERDWSLIVTTKRHNIRELRERGVKSALFMWSAYDHRYHLGEPATTHRRHSLGFIGVARPDRTWLPKVFASVAKNSAIVRGPGWRRRYPVGVRGVAIGGLVPADRFLDVAGLIFGGPVLLNSDNRDTHTCRTFEVPAAGMLVIAERTAEHVEMFEDGREALLFSGREELAALLARVARDTHALEAVAAAGHRRITQGGNTYLQRAGQIVDAL